MKKIVIIATVPLSFATLIKGQPKFLSTYYDVRLITSFSDMNKNIELEEGVEIKNIDMTRKITPFKDIIALFKIFLYLKKEKPEIVYTFTPKAGLLGMIASFLSNTPIRIHNIVGMPLMEAAGIKKNILIFIEKLTYIFATNLFCNSFGLKEYINNNLTSKDVKVIGHGSINGIDANYYKNDYSKYQIHEIRKKYKFSDNDFVILYVGRIVKDKGINELIQSFNLIMKKNSNTKLLLVGDYEKELNPINIENERIIMSSNSIISVGFQNNIKDFLAISNLFVLPSYREGLPNSLLEAGSFGIPLVATEINGCNEIIINNVNGKLVKPKDVVDLSSTIEELILNKELYHNIKLNVRKTIIERYEQKVFWTALKDEFERFI